MRRVAVIPARLGSLRVPRKNLRLLGRRPLLAWAVQAAQASGLFDRVMVSTEADEIAELAQTLGADVHRRPAHLAEGHVTSEAIMADALRAEPDCTRLFQVLPTSPLLEPASIVAADRLLDSGADTVLAVREIRAEVMLGGPHRPLNFEFGQPMRPSQELEPAYALCNGVFAWDAQSFQRREGSACFGRFGSVSLLVLKGDEALDIDTEDDWQRAEIAVARRAAPTSAPRYWTATRRAETDETQVLQGDGVPGKMRQVDDAVRHVDDAISLLHRCLPDDVDGATRVVEMPGACATLIGQSPGHGNRRHYHPDADEWWLVLEGEYEFEVDGQRTIIAQGGIMAVERGRWHQITARGTQRAVRLAASRPGIEHVYAD